MCKTYTPTVVKTHFPYDFVKDKTLFYKGVKPAITLYKNLEKNEYKFINEKLYKLIPKDNWSTKNETLKYLEHDLISLFKVMETFIKHIWLNYGIHVTNSYTISGISMNIFLKNFYNNNIPLINKKSVHNDIRKSYYGGNTEVYKPYGRNLFYYDVNSLYPYSAFKSMPGINCVYIQDINKNIKDCYNDLFGFYYCKIKTTDHYFGFIPVRLDNGSIIMPNGNIEGWYFSEELKFAHEQGYDINVLYGYKFDKNLGVFDKYVEHFYKIKSNTLDKVERWISKSFLNNLLGRFGLNINKPITKLVDFEEFQEILQTRKIVGDVKHINDKYLITFENDISKDLCDKYQVDYKETFNNFIKNNKLSRKFKQEPNYISVSISSVRISVSISIRIRINIRGE